MRFPEVIVGFTALVVVSASNSNAARDTLHGLVAKHPSSNNIAAVTPAAVLERRQGGSGGGGGGGGGGNQQAQQQLQQQLQQASASFSSRLAQITQQASQEAQQASQSLQQISQRIQQFQQSVQSLQQSADSVRQSADSAINSVRSSADSQIKQADASASNAVISAVASAQAAASAGQVPTYPACPTPAANGAATVTAFVTVTATARINVAAQDIGDGSGGGGGAEAQTPQPTFAMSTQTTDNLAQTQMLGTLNMCGMPGKALTIAGVVIGVIGLLSLGFAVWIFRRRRRSMASPALSETSSVAAYDITKPFELSKPSAMPNWWPLKPAAPQVFSNDIVGIKNPAGRATKGNISKPRMMSFWPPNLWRRGDSRLSFKDVGGPTVPNAPYNNFR